MNKELLEAYIDRYGLKAVLRALAEICFDKAEHIAVQWQDASTAKQWSTNGELIAKAEEELES